MNKSLICLSAIAMGLTSINVANAANATGTLTVKQRLQTVVFSTLLQQVLRQMQF
ncbi:hypothetical protein WP2W18E11_14190 [Acinetobacter pittii]|uniref:Uncharacterized protein n=1 Tax=Acinetobacter pittii TaxID=48296 RepID=A0A6S4UJV9_ACIPI|nr:hypothetical protein WP2W18E11_14190 [Acinetobacter pittii]